MDAVGSVNPLFFASLTIVIVGAIVTLVSAPKPGKKPKSTADEQPPLWDKAREESAANIAAEQSVNDEPEDAGDSDPDDAELSEEAADTTEAEEAASNDSDEMVEQDTEPTDSPDED